MGDVLPDKIVYDAQTTSGGSGGPLLDRNGGVIGVTFAIVRGFGGSNFGVPIRYATPLLEALWPHLIFLSLSLKKSLLCCVWLPA